MGTTQLETVQEPKYWHLKTVLSEALDSDFAVGEILPNERELAARFGVARATLRQALEQLELEGRLQRRRGVGTTVAPPRVGVAVSTAQRDWSGGGAAEAWQPVDCSTAVPPSSVVAVLDVEADEAVHIVRRIRVTHGQTVAAELLYIPSSSVPELSAIDAPSGPQLGPVVSCANCTVSTSTVRTGRWSSARHGWTTPRSSTGFPAPPC